jgi:hypothetical protein
MVSYRLLDDRKIEVKSELRDRSIDDTDVATL